MSRGSLLSRFRSQADCEPLAARSFELMREIYPFCRSITGDGVRKTLEHLAHVAPLEIFEIASGTRVFDWEVPSEWNIREAYIADSAGRRIVDFADHNLHVVSYSVPIQARMTLEQLRPHLFTLPDHPEWIPYRTSYYQKSWGFCLAHRVLENLKEGEYQVLIDVDIKPGSLTYAECRIAGETDDEVLIYTHVCHPSLANDNASGMALAAVLAEQLSAERPRLSYRFVFAPGTIGAITWLARNEHLVPRLRAGLVVGLVGDPGPLTYKRSRRTNSEVDWISAAVVRELDPNSRVVDFSPYGYDERQFCSPGFNLPVGRLTRSPNGEYPEYHSSADDLSLIQPQALAQSCLALVSILARLDCNRRFRSLNPKCEPRLGKRGLFRSIGGANPGQTEQAMLWLLNQADGLHGIQDVSAQSGIAISALDEAADTLVNAGLLEEVGIRTEPKQGSQGSRARTTGRSMPAAQSGTR